MFQRALCTYPHKNSYAAALSALQTVPEAYDSSCTPNNCQIRILYVFAFADGGDSGIGVLHSVPDHVHIFHCPEAAQAPDGGSCSQRNGSQRCTAISVLCDHDERPAAKGHHVRAIRRRQVINDTQIGVYDALNMHLNLEELSSLYRCRTGRSTPKLGEASVKSWEVVQSNLRHVADGSSTVPSISDCFLCCSVLHS